MDFSSLKPKPAGWLASELDYSGWGMAELSTPRSLLEGPVTARFDEYGGAEIELEVQELSSETAPRFGPLQLLSGAEVVEGESGVSMPITLHANPCTALSVQTPGGTFSAADNIHYTYGVGAVTKLRFHLLRSQFRSKVTGPARYWVLPLYNLITGFRQRHPSVDRHPLRIFPTPVIPDDVEGDDRAKALLVANQKNRLILFKHSGLPAFIEALPDYEQRVTSLTEGRERCLVTCVAVGQIPEGRDSDEFVKQFPMGLVRVLSFSSGTDVGASWLELRDSDGDLVSRYHWTGHPVFSKGRPVIDEAIHGGTGHLLKRWLAQDRDHGNRIATAMPNLVRSGEYDGPSYEERLRLGFLAVEQLFAIADIAQNLEIGEPSLLNELGGAVDDAVARTRDLAAKAAKDGHHGDAKVITRIAARLDGQRTPSASFGDRVGFLMSGLGLEDERVMSQDYSSIAWDTREKDWLRLLTKYRGMVMHGETLDPDSNDELEMAYRTANHVKDLATRCILQLLDYEGLYQPQTVDFVTRCPVGWVDASRHVTDLGYEIDDPPAS
ncbi:MAG: hypothetical protein JXA57_14395 [Armatimonadetes bacterium]|nr:hypothetical protein [Armatimonadota bacterium]